MQSQEIDKQAYWMKKKHKGSCNCLQYVTEQKPIYNNKQLVHTQSG